MYANKQKIWNLHVCEYQMMQFYFNVVYSATDNDNYDCDSQSQRFAYVPFYNVVFALWS